MKHMNKILALALALIMVLGLATTAYAAEGYTVTINNATGHTYQIYQIFTGDLSTNEQEEEVLSNIKYGADYLPDGVAAGTLVPEDVLDTLSTNATSINPTGTGTAMVTEGDAAKATGLAAGYYMIKDVTEKLPEGDERSAVIFQVVGDTTVTSKHTGTTIVKKVQDINDSTGEQPKDGDSVWIDSADYDIGDTVPFKSTATFEGLDNYDTYEVVFTDIMAKGLAYKGDMKVYVNGVDKTSDFTITTATCTDNDEYKDGTVITVTCENIKPLANGNSATIVLEYSATLDTDANLGAPGNPNKIKVTTKPDGTGETPWDVNIVFTYKSVVNKVDPEDKPLTGAEFKLEKFVASANGTETFNAIKGNWVEKTLVKNNENTTFTFTGLDDGEYRITETKAPEGYNAIDPIYFTVTADHDVVAADPELKSLEANSKEINTFEATVSNGVISTDIENKPGVVLPETGGMGTTLFYAIGGLLVAAAVILLVTKKRMASAE